MCQVNDDDLNAAFETKPDLKVFRKCLKCDDNSVIVTRISEALCKACFLEYVTHKFRATIGKNLKKSIDRNELVLFPYSASASSVAMLNLIVKGVGEEAKKKFTFLPVILYIEDSEVFSLTNGKNDRIERLRRIQKSIEYSGFKVYFSLLENSISGDSAITSIYSDDIEKLDFNQDLRANFLKLIETMSNETSREEILKRLKLKLINQIAKHLNINKCLLALNCSKLTVDLLTNVAIGKGAHLSAETSLEEKRQDGITYIRPLREVTSKEIAFYNYYMNLNEHVQSNNTSLLNLPNSSIYRLTEKFINGLQNDFPTTVSTIFRTSDKLTPSDDLVDSEKNCILCQCPLDTKVNLASTSSAINDLEYAKSIARIGDTTSDNRLNPWKDNNSIADKLCYSCSIVISDVKNKETLPNFIKEKLKDDMKNQISDFLLD